MKLLIIGGVATGPTAAARARRLSSEAQITIVEEGAHLSYARCGLPYFLAGLVPQADDLQKTIPGTVRDAHFFQDYKNVQALTRTRAETLDRKRKTVGVVNLDTGEHSEFDYDKLVIATGARPVRLSVPGSDLQRAFPLHSLDDALAVHELLASGQVKQAVVLGAGTVGLEIADALVGKGIRTTLLEAAAQVLPGLLDPEVAAVVAGQLNHPFLELHTGTPVVSLEGDQAGMVRRVVTPGGSFAADMVLLDTGLQPNVELARAAGLAIGVTGAIAVDESLRTSDPDIYAGGDCVENEHLLTGQKVFLPRASLAGRHGRIIGSNVVGGRERFRGLLDTAVVQAFDCNVARTGLSEGQARAAGRAVVTALISGMDCAHFYPLHAPIVLKLIADRESGRVLGAQAAGEGETVKRIDVLATAISLGATTEDVAGLDLGQAPPFAPAVDPAILAASVVRNKLAGVAHGQSTLEVQARLAGGEDLVVLDVRGAAAAAAAAAAGHIQGSRVLSMPLGTLRARLASLPRDKALVTLCSLGVSSYDAQCILSGAGFEDVSFVEGGLEAWPGA
jgi:NADPH-dependent 2,4-dienoyl-CoA reductase/sulfur reductase-like enzyme/rhodanese-related sulfurtransferase